MIDKTELQNAMKQYQLKAMVEVFDDDFVDKILKFDSKDPLREIYIDGIYNYYKDNHFRTGINKIHDKVLQLDIGIKELERMSAMGFDDICMEDVPVFGETKPDMALVPEERMKSMLENGKNPYFRRSKDGKTLIKISFANNGVRLSDALAGALVSQ